jgi:hypothetical protein
MADKELKEPIEATGETRGTLPSGVDEVAAIPKGTIDPVYEAKARVLNHAVRESTPSPGWQNSIFTADNLADSRDWHGMVPMAALHRRWFWLGER